MENWLNREPVRKLLHFIREPSFCATILQCHLLSFPQNCEAGNRDPCVEHSGSRALCLATGNSILSITIADKYGPSQKAVLFGRDSWLLRSCLKRVWYFSWSSVSAKLHRYIRVFPCAGKNKCKMLCLSSSWTRILVKKKKRFCFILQALISFSQVSSSRGCAFLPVK